jgi:hypothetical protein
MLARWSSGDRAESSNPAEELSVRTFPSFPYFSRGREWRVIPKMLHDFLEMGSDSVLEALSGAVAAVLSQDAWRLLSRGLETRHDNELDAAYLHHLKSPSDCMLVNPTSGSGFSGHGSLLIRRGGRWSFLRDL